MPKNFELCHWLVLSNVTKSLNNPLHKVETKRHFDPEFLYSPKTSPQGFNKLNINELTINFLK